MVERNSSVNRRVERYEITNTALLQYALFPSQPQDFDPSARSTLEKLHTRAMAKPARLTRKAQTVLDGIYRDNQDLVQSVGAERIGQVSQELYSMVKARDTSRRRLIGRWTTEGYITSIDVLGNGTIDWDKVKNQERFQNKYPDPTNLLDELRELKLSPRHRLRKQLTAPDLALQVSQPREIPTVAAIAVKSGGYDRTDSVYRSWEDIVRRLREEAWRQEEEEARRPFSSKLADKVRRFIPNNPVRKLSVAALLAISIETAVLYSGPIGDTSYYLNSFVNNIAQAMALGGGGGETPTSTPTQGGKGGGETPTSTPTKGKGGGTPTATETPRITHGTILSFISSDTLNSSRV